MPAIQQHSVGLNVHWKVTDSAWNPDFSEHSVSIQWTFRNVSVDWKENFHPVVYVDIEMPLPMLRVYKLVSVSEWFLQQMHTVYRARIVRVVNMKDGRTYFHILLKTLSIKNIKTPRKEYKQISPVTVCLLVYAETCFSKLIEN